jgi:hypothetical protein
MNMAPLRHTPPLRGIAWQHVALDNCHGPVEVGEHPSGEQATHACAKDNRALTDPAHQEPPPRESAML